MSLAPLQDSACTRCELSQSCRSVCLPGEGPLDSEVMVVGIAPGGFEDGYRFGPIADWPLGRPFVGESGQLLRGVLADNGFAVMPVSSETTDEEGYPTDLLPVPLVRLTNLARCRPPQNRDPTAEELRACSIYLDDELSKMPNLKYIVALGTLPMKSLGVAGSVTDLAGVPRKTGKYTVIPIFHPAAVLRRQTYLSTWQAHWHQVRNIVRPSTDSFATKVGATVHEKGLEGKNWRDL